MGTAPPFMIHHLPVLLLLFLFPAAGTPGRAESVTLSDIRTGKPVPGSNSPDGNYCLLQVFRGETSQASVIIADTGRTRNFGDVPVQAEASSGLLYKGRTSIVWSPDSTRFAVHDASRKHSKVSIYRLTATGFERAETSNLFADACGHFGIKEGSVASSGQKPVRWPAGDAVEVEVTLRLQNGKTLRQTLAVPAPLQPPALAPLADTARRLIRVTNEYGGLGTPPGSELVAEVKGDTAKGRKLIDELWALHRQSFPEEMRFNYGPDAGFTQIELVRGDERIVVGSWHTREQNVPTLFASHRNGLAPLGNRTREEALAAEPESYQRFRKSFDAISEAAAQFKRR
jgi:hypothetical protein